MTVLDRTESGLRHRADRVAESMPEVVIKVLHTEGCAGASRAVEQARLAAADFVAGTATVESVLIEDDASARAEHLRGSPTVLVNGADVEIDPATPVGSFG